MAQLARREAVHWFGVTQCLGQRGDQQRDRGEALLAVDDAQRRLVRHLGQPRLDVDNGADEVLCVSIVPLFVSVEKPG